MTHELIDGYHVCLDLLVFCLDIETCSLFDVVQLVLIETSINNMV